MLQSQMNSTAQYTFQTSDRSWYCMLLYNSAKLALSMGLCQPRERVKFGQQYLSEKVALSFNLFTEYMLYILTNFKSQKGSMESLYFWVITS